MQLLKRLLVVVALAIGVTVVVAPSPASAFPPGTTVVHATVGFNLRGCPELACPYAGWVDKNTAVLDYCYPYPPDNPGWRLVYRTSTRHAGFAPTGNLSGSHSDLDCYHSPTGYGYATKVFNLRSCPDLSCSWSGGVQVDEFFTAVCYLLDSTGQRWTLVYSPIPDRAGFAPAGAWNPHVPASHTCN
jgi:hypothetical protein